ncbi:unnamed protein product [Dimorphilus gyrociliatus]|uniref:Uncharacterized protein n=1 Tax=Dimorphilus gyrociliatus TaxID=2664684 RepID=A0A7I8VY84_9ANNE|nr:unnamed protein product [Dimorphilus gyrociliatus]
MTFIKLPARLRTYKDAPSWSLSWSKLSMLGFYYVYDDRSIRCFECGCIITNFENLNMQSLIHKSGCSMQRELEKNKAEKMTLSLTSFPSSGCTNSLSLSSFSSSNEENREQFQKNSLEDDSISSNDSDCCDSCIDNNLDRTFLKDDLQKVSQRYLTFKDWPLKNVIEAKELAEAGFHYLGVGDRVQCFHCNGILRKWSYGDKPLVEHLKHFPHCSYALNKRNNI